MSDHLTVDGKLRPECQCGALRGESHEPYCPASASEFVHPVRNHDMIGVELHGIQEDLVRCREENERLRERVEAAEKRVEELESELANIATDANSGWNSCDVGHRGAGWLRNIELRARRAAQRGEGGE